jgi:hypothetical protein
MNPSRAIPILVVCLAVLTGTVYVLGRYYEIASDDYAETYVQLTNLPLVPRML